MTTYRIFPATNGPASPVGFSGSFISGVNFAISSGNTWFQGYWWWVSNTGQSTSPVKCALWCDGGTTNPGSGGGQVLVPGSVVTSGTLIAGQWNYIPLAVPLQLSQGYSPGMNPGTAASTSYIAAIGCNGAFPDTNGFWGTAGPGQNGLSNGPLFAYSATVAAGGTIPPPHGFPQGCFSTAGSDPSTTCPLASSNSDNFWVDVQVSDTGPAGYTGTYRLWPNKSDANEQTVADSAVAYNVATEIDISQAVTLNYIHYFVPGNVATPGLATKADVWEIDNQTLVASISSPSWVTESGGAVNTSSTSGQWVKAAFPAGVTLPAGKYRVSVYNANGALGGWSSKDANTNYFSTGVGQNGITWGPLTAPNQASAQLANFFPGTGTGTTGGQPVFASDGLNSYPNQTTGTNPAQIYWVDLEVTPLPVSPVYSPVMPGKSWRRRFSPVRQIPVYTKSSVTSVFISGQGAFVNSSSVFGSIYRSTPQPAIPISPGRTWRKRFSPVHQVAVYAKFVSSPVNVAGLTSGVSVSSPVGSVYRFTPQPAKPIHPGKTWNRKFRYSHSNPPWRSFSAQVLVQGTVSVSSVSSPAFQVSVSVRNPVPRAGVVASSRLGGFGLFVPVLQWKARLVKNRI